MIIEITGTKELNGLIYDLRGRRLQEAVKKPVSESFQEMQADLKEYPSPPSSSTYRRTGDLRRSWKRRTLPQAGVLGFVQSDLDKYEHWVMNRRQQARVHRGRWQTVDDVAEKHEGPFIDAISRHVQRAIDRVG